MAACYRLWIICLFSIAPQKPTQYLAYTFYFCLHIHSSFFLIYTLRLALYESSIFMSIWDTVFANIVLLLSFCFSTKQGLHDFNFSEIGLDMMVCAKICMLQYGTFYWCCSHCDLLAFAFVDAVKGILKLQLHKDSSESSWFLVLEPDLTRAVYGMVFVLVCIPYIHVAIKLVCEALHWILNWNYSLRHFW
jgi:hypothetical protein